LPDISLAEIEKGMKNTGSGQSYEQIVNEYFSDKNLELKTDIEDKLAMTMLDSAAEWSVTAFGKENGDFIKMMTRWYRVNAVSHRRKSRDEVSKILTNYASAQKDEESKLVNRLMGR